MTAIDARQEEVVLEFELFSDWMEKYEYIIDMGKSLPKIDESKKTDDHLVKGCQSKVWLDSKLENGTMHFNADSDALITRGIIALLIRVMNNEKPEDIFKADLWFIDKIGLKEHLSPSRSNGLAGMIRKMKEQAILSVKNELT